jgi:hypothetical protein
MALLLTGCTTAMKYGDVPESKLENVDFKNYELGKQSSAYVGEQLISRKKYQTLVKKNLFQAQNDFSLQGGLGATSINLSASAGDTFRVAGVNEHNNPVVNIPGSIFMFGISSSGQWDQTVMSPSFWTSPIGSGNQYKITPVNTDFKAVISQIPFSEAGYINHEIIFTGVGANGISLLYREYTFENMARSDFKQELVYPVNSKKIRFRNYQINLVSVSPSEIKYKVISE